MHCRLQALLFQVSREKKMNTGLHFRILLVLILMSVSPGRSWSLFSFSSSSPSEPVSGDTNYMKNSVAEFSMDGFRDEKGMKLIENAKNKLNTFSNSCWQNSYQQLFAGCSQILAEEDKRSRFAWHLSDCFQRDSGRPPFPSCGSKSAMITCLKKLNDNEHKVYLEFLLETNSICYQLQAHAFKHNMERLVNDLRNSAHHTTDQLEIIKEKTNLLSENSDQINETLSSIDSSVQNLAQTTQDVKGHVHTLSQHSDAIYEKSKEIANSQSEIREEQTRMNEKLKEGMETIHDAYTNLGEQVEILKTEAVEIEKQIDSVGEKMRSKMQNLQNTADDIENKAEKSLEQQKQLIDGQSTAIKGLQLLTESQSEAMEESRSTVQRLVEFGHKQQEELLQRQQKLQQIHDHLIQNSNSILAAQEAFESKQASMFIALDKLFALHNAMLLESRIIKSFFIYSMAIFIIYMFTSTKQTYTVRARLYIGLCATFFIEIAILRVSTNDIEQQAWVINLIRSSFGVLSSIQFLHAVFTYRDYEVLNHHMIQTLIDKVNEIQRNKEETEESDVNWISWVETELPEEVDNLEDPDYLFPEEVGENSIVSTSSLTRKYYLRPRTRTNS